MKRQDKKDTKKSLELRKETLRQLDPGDLGEVAGGYYYYYRTCMGTWAGYKP